MRFHDRVSADSALTPVESPPTVFVIDPDSSVRTSLELLICRAGWRSRMFASAEEFLALRRPIVGLSSIISEVELPGLSGLELQAVLVGEQNIPVVFLTSQLNVPITVRAMKAGAIEFLTKPFREETLLHALRSAFERCNETFRQEDELRTLRERYATLSEREREVMALVVSGLLNKQVGGRLCISEITVKAHRGKVMRKMQADSLPALVDMAATLGLPRPASGVRCTSLGRERPDLSVNSMAGVSALP